MLLSTKNRYFLLSTLLIATSSIYGSEVKMVSNSDELLKACFYKEGTDEEQYKKDVTACLSHNTYTDSDITTVKNKISGYRDLAQKFVAKGVPHPVWSLVSPEDFNTSRAEEAANMRHIYGIAEKAITCYNFTLELLSNASHS